MVAVCMVTYNHEKYIDEAIKSVLMQETDFPFEIVIGEDCSRDKTREICLMYKEKYPGKIRLILHNENKGLVKNTISVLEDIKSRSIEYIAMLDGDDYWIDSLKLQKQIDFMRKFPDFGLIHTGCDNLYANKRIKSSTQEIPDGNVSEYINNKYSIANCTVLFRTNLLDLLNLNDYVENKFMSCDYVTYIIFSHFTKFKYLKDVTAIWRRGHASISNTNELEKQIEYINNDLLQWEYLDKIFNNKYGYSNLAADSYRNYKIFNIAFQYYNFGLANQSNKKLLKKYKISRIKRIAASNKVAFFLWHKLKKIKKILT